MVSPKPVGERAAASAATASPRRTGRGWSCWGLSRFLFLALSVWLAFLGGLAVFGVSGMILGPAIAAVTIALLDVWRHSTAETPITPGEAEPTAEAIVGASADPVANGALKSKEVIDV
jgi:hypothetical protein